MEIRHRFPDGPSLDLRLRAPLPGVVALWGPSGSGKSSLVSALGGFFRPDAAVIRIGAHRLAGPALWVPPEKRRIGTVFQDARLFPHLSVEGNLRFGARRAPPGERGSEAPSLEEVASLLELEALLGRRVHGLSGGEARRVAIGRAILSRPRLLAMDEPLTGLDDRRRAEILPFLSRLRSRLALPILYVTHALDEVLELADTLALVEDGRIGDTGPVAEVLHRSALAVREDAGALLFATVRRHDPAAGLTFASLGANGSDGVLRVPLRAQPPGTPLRLRIPARDVILVDAPDGHGLPAISAQNLLPVRVSGVRPLPDRNTRLVLLELRGGSGTPAAVMMAHLSADAVERLRIQPGRPMLALVKAVAVDVLGGPARGIADGTHGREARR
ncbi:molybdenum ABC transporter ATP-binding protein [Rhizosaccharibacter radicis]|uniref:Molybdenum ABC transporter ATP-binding protein n=1 Tax=Rhizosaccharibacter radicis TaxID=2782605 RepID=A0ABT1VUF4_9PROT|nr:molybdenum ABC transporter ATP-binding protein [Acetobacteraceae bacterium KSS12]